MGYFDGEWSITDMTNPQQPALSTAPISLNAPKITTGVTSINTPKLSEVFDPEAGMYDAYIKARNESIGADASKRKLERFYKKFRKLWDQGEALRKSEFNWNQGMTETNQNIDNARLNILNIGQQTVLNFKNSFKPFENTSKPAVQKPVVPKNETPIILVKTNLDPATNPHEGGGSMRHVYNPSNTQETNVTPPVSNIFSSNTFNTAGKKFTGTFNSMDEFNNAFTDWYGKRKGFWSGGSYSEGKKWDSARDLMLQEYLKFHNLESLPDKKSQQSNNIMNNFYSYFGSLPYKKLGGNINRYQQGGKQMNEQELLLAVIGYIITTKKQPKSELEVQAIAQEVAGMKQSNPQQYQQLVQMGQQAQLQLAGAKVAALGSKLNYIRKIKGLCPEGEELVYMKQGGRVCPVCQKKAEKAQKGAELEKKRQNTVKQWKADRAKAKDEAARDSVAINKYNDQETMVNKGHKGKFKNGVWTPNRKEYTKKNACGAKMKKK